MTPPTTPPTPAPLTARLRRLALTPCDSPDDLHRWVRLFCGLGVPRHPVCDGHAAPFDYLCRSYFEPAADQVVWAPRGGGKTRLAAVATLLDLLHKPGAAVRILGGSLEQSLKTWDYLTPDLARLAADLLADRKPASRRVALSNGSTAAVLTQSERAVRGLRVQKLRCDEVELFKPEVWEAAQLVTKSRNLKSETSDSESGPGARPRPVVAGTLEALSTLHAPFGLMHRVVEDAGRSGVAVVRWCLLEVLERCPPTRDCAACPLWDDCRGVAKTRCDGFVGIDDAVAMKRRVSAETWDAEILCRRPSVRGCVFPTFDPAVHVKEWVVGRCKWADRSCGADAPSSPTPDSQLPTTDSQLPTTHFSLAVDFGFAAPFVCLWVETHADGTAHVVDEYLQPQRTLDEHVAAIRARPWPAGATPRVACDPAGAGRNEQTAASAVTVLRRAGFAVRHRQSRIADGLELIRRALRPASGDPKLFVHPRCEKLVRALRSYRYPEGGGELPVKDGEHDHPVDALRYHFVNRADAAPAEGRRY